MPDWNPRIKTQFTFELHFLHFSQATSLLKKAEGVVTLTVCNPNQSKVAKEEEDKAKGIIPEPERNYSREISI